MRNFTVRYSIRCLAGVVMGLVLICGEVSMPSPAHARDDRRPLEEAGDPDMPDRASVTPSETGIVTVVTPGETGTVRDGADARVSWRVPALGSDENGTSRGWRRAYFIRLWSSVATWLFAF